MGMIPTRQVTARYWTPAGHEPQQVLVHGWQPAEGSPAVVEVLAPAGFLLDRADAIVLDGVEFMPTEPLRDFTAGPWANPVAGRTITVQAASRLTLRGKPEWQFVDGRDQLLPGPVRYSGPGLLRMVARQAADQPAGEQQVTVLAYEGAIPVVSASVEDVLHVDASPLTALTDTDLTLTAWSADEGVLMFTATDNLG